MADAFRRQYADLPPNHFAVVPNGFDPRQFGAFAGPPEAPQRDTFEVLHSGALYYGRSVAAFLTAVERLLGEDADFSKAFRLTLLGTLDAAAQAEVRASALGKRVCFRGQVDHAASLAAMRDANLLLLVANTTPGAEATVPGKIFEYLAVRKPILAIAPPASSTRDVLDRTGGAFVAPADDPAAIARLLRAAFVAHQRDEVLAPDQKEVSRFDRRVIAADLAGIFNQLVAPANARRI
jgi:hypothetical protein